MVGVGVGSGMGVKVGRGVGVGVGVGIGVDVGAAVAKGAGVGVGIAVAVGTGLGITDGVEVGIGVLVGTGVAEGISPTRLATIASTVAAILGVGATSEQPNAATNKTIPITVARIFGCFIYHFGDVPHPNLGVGREELHGIQVNLTVIYAC
jgi:hypothetical protein